MKIYTSKFDDVFYLPITNNSCGSDLSYKITINDAHRVLSLESTDVSGGPANSAYITVPKIPSLGVDSGTLWSFCDQNSLYYLEIHVPSTQRFIQYTPGTNFFIFYGDGSTAGTEIQFLGFVGQFPRFSIDQYSLLRLTGVLPDSGNYLSVTRQYNLCLEDSTRNYLKVSTSTKSKGSQYATITFDTSGKPSTTFEFYVNPQEDKVTKINLPPIGIREEKTVQLSRSFIPLSSVVTLQVDSTGALYMDKISSSSVPPQLSYRRRCTNLGFEGDLKSFVANVPKDSIYSFNQPDLKVSTQKFSEQYFTDINSGVELNHETRESLRIFSPIWIRGSVPKYFAIFRKPVSSNSDNPIKDSELVKLIDINTTELGPYLSKLTSNANFYKSPIEVDIDSNYLVKWNGLSIDGGYWMGHTEFLGSDIQKGVSDFEFNDLITSGFSRGSLICPQFLNIEFLFDDVTANKFEVYQYFGLYTDSIDMGSFYANIEATSSVFEQDFSRSSSSSDYNSSLIQSPDGVKIVVDIVETIEKKFTYKNPSIIDQSINTRYKVSVGHESSSSKKMVLTTYTEIYPQDQLANSPTLRLETSSGDFVSYLTVSSFNYDASTTLLTINVEQTDVYSSDGNTYFVRFFDYDPGNDGGFRLDSTDISKSGCLIISKTDYLGVDVLPWVNSVIQQHNDFKENVLMYDRFTSAYVILQLDTIDEESSYIKVYFTLLESSGQFSPGDEVFIDVSPSSIPLPNIINSSNRKFIFGTKDSYYSVKKFEFINIDNSIKGSFTIDSPVFDLSKLMGSVSTINAPVAINASPYQGVELGFPLDSNSLLGDSDAIIVERVKSNKVYRWVAIKNTGASNYTSSISGAIRDIPVLSMSSTDQYVTIEIDSSLYHPNYFDSFKLIDSTSGSLDVAIDLTYAENVGGGSNRYRMYFSNISKSIDYQYIQVTSYESKITYFDYTSVDSLSREIASAFQRFDDCPVQSTAYNGKLYLYSKSKIDDVNVKVVSQNNSINQITFNGTKALNNSLKIDGVKRFSSVYTYPMDIIFGTTYSIDSNYVSNFVNASVLSKSGRSSNICTWNNGLISIPDISSIVDYGIAKELIQFDGSGLTEPSLLNNRLQISTTPKLTLGLMSFYSYVDLDFFNEIPSKDSSGVVFTEASNAPVSFGIEQQFVNPEEPNSTIALRSRLYASTDNSTANFASSIFYQSGKIYPTVGRWKRRNSHNSNLSDYSLNVDPLQMQYDYMSGVSTSDIDPSIFPLDFYIIGGWPSSAIEADEFAYDYLGRSVDIEMLKSVKYDHFSDYFTVGKGTENFVSGNSRPNKHLWSTIKNEGTYYSTLFKGIPLKFSSSSVDLTGVRFAAVLQVEPTLDVPSKINVVYNKAWNSLTLFVQISLDGTSINSSVTYDQLYNLSFNSIDTTFGILRGPMTVYGSDTFSFDLSDKAYNKKTITQTNALNENNPIFGGTTNVEMFRKYEYSTNVTLEYDHTALRDIELFNVPYYPNSDYLITGDLFTGTGKDVRTTIVIPKSRIRGVYDPSTKTNRTFIDGSYSDSFFGSICDSITGPSLSKFSFVTKDTIRCNGWMRVYGQNSNPVDVSMLKTNIFNVTVSVVGDYPVYADTIKNCTAYSVLRRINNGDYNDIEIGLSGDVSNSNISIQYLPPSKIKPVKFNSSKLDQFGRVTSIVQPNDLNIFRLSGEFEPSFKDLLLFSSAEETSIIKQTLNSFKGYNTNIIGVDKLSLWYRRVSTDAINSGMIDVNGTNVEIPYAMGKKYITPTENTWSDHFYSKAKDRYSDLPIDGLTSLGSLKFFLSSNVMNIPSYLRTSTYSIMDMTSNGGVGSPTISYVKTKSNLSAHIDITKIIRDELFSSGVYSFFESEVSKLNTNYSPYTISEEYISSNLLSRYEVTSIEIYSKPSGVSEIVTSDVSPELNGFSLINTVGRQTNDAVDINVPLDGSSQICFSFNINRI